MDDQTPPRSSPHESFGRRQVPAVEQREQPRAESVKPSAEASHSFSLRQIPLREILLAGIAFLLLVVVVLQVTDRFTTAATGTLDDAGRIQWEYLVVSPGSIFFSLMDDEMAGIKFGEEQANLIHLRLLRISSHTTSTLDVMGMMGWELVAVTGQIGGDQQFILKRQRIST